MVDVTWEVPDGACIVEGTTAAQDRGLMGIPTASLEEAGSSNTHFQEVF